ncbi:MAG: hypothetical protein NVS9B9_15110 [Ktedonobacteraceae bacterium]
MGAWTADTFRATFGPTITAQVESWYLGISDKTHQLQYQLSGKPVTSPWTVKPTATPTMASSNGSTHIAPTMLPMSLSSMQPFVTPSIGGEGVWQIQDTALAPHTDLPVVAKAFIRPDPSHPYALATLLQFDTRFSFLHMVAGISQPGGPVGKSGTGGIPATDQNGNSLLAVLNGGFKYADGHYGMASQGTVYVPPQPGAATLAVTKEGQIALGAWGKDPLLTSTNTDLAAWRQNGALLIDNGINNPLTQDGAAWGGTILNRAYTWRSGIGITAQNTLVYAAGDTLTAQTLAEALHTAGAVMAMQTDINPFWVRAFLYQRLSNGTLSIAKLYPSMQGSGYEYLYKSEQRDFFYITRVTNPPQPLRRSTSHGPSQ